MTRAPTEAIDPGELAGLQEKVRQLEAEKAADHEAMAVAVKRIQDRVSWVRGLTLPAASHLDGCPARPSRIESFDADRGARTVRCQDCGQQTVFWPPTATARLEV